MSLSLGAFRVSEPSIGVLSSVCKSDRYQSIFFLLPGGASVMSTVKWMDGEILHTYEYISIFHILYIGFMSELERNGKK